jgi:chromosome segregation ATPase
MCSLLEHAHHDSTDRSGRSALSDHLQVLREMREQKREAKHRLRDVNHEYDSMRADVLQQIERVSERRKQNERHRTELQRRINEDAENEHELRQLDEELCRRC